MIGYAVTVKGVSVTQRSRSHAGSLNHDGNVEIHVQSPEGEISLQIAFERERTLDDAVATSLQRVANWARYISQSAEEAMGHDRPHLADCAAATSPAA
jgi:putative heme iron utilization protein